MKLRVLNYNIHKGRAFLLRKKTWHLFHDLIRSAKPDVIFLQEFLVEEDTESLLERLADSVWPHYSFGRNAAVGGFHYGNAILSRFPIGVTYNTDISTNALERRSILYACTKIGTQDFHLFCCHLDLRHVGREKQLLAMRKKILPLVKKDAFILAGDFNDWSERLHPEIGRSLGVEEASCAVHGKLMATAPSFLPLFSLDRVYFHKLHARKVALLRDIPWALRSDHMPMLVDFEII